MAARVFNVDELATRIATHLEISPKSTLALALTCRAVEVPALRALWGTQDTLKFLFICVLPTDVWCFGFLPYVDLSLLVSPLVQSVSCILSTTEISIGITATTYHVGVA